MPFEDKGRIRVVFHYRRKRFTEALGLDYNVKNLQAAQRIERDLKAAIRAGAFDRAFYQQFFPDGKKAALIFGVIKPEPESATVPTLAEFALSWLEERRVELSNTSHYDYRCVIRKHIEGSMVAGMPIDQVRDGDLKLFIASLQQKEVGARRINFVIARLRTILASAAPQFDFKDPMKAVKNLRAPKTEVDPFTADEARRLCAAAAGQDRALISLLIHTGLRPNEAMALSWPDVDFERRYLIVRKNLTRFGMGLPKTPGAEQRTVDLDAEVLAELR